DLRTSILLRARESGLDALPELRALIRPKVGVVTPVAPLDWHYKLPMESPTFLVADGRTRKFLPPAEEGRPAPDHLGRQFDKAQLSWLEDQLGASGGPAAFIAFATPFLVHRAMSFMMNNLWAMVLLGQLDRTDYIKAYQFSPEGGIENPMDEELRR